MRAWPVPVTVEWWQVQLVTGGERGSEEYSEGLKRVHAIELMLRKLNPKATLIN